MPRAPRARRDACAARLSSASLGTARDIAGSRGDVVECAVWTVACSFVQCPYCIHLHLHATELYACCRARARARAPARPYSYTYAACATSHVAVRATVSIYRLYPIYTCEPPSDTCTCCVHVATQLHSTQTRVHARGARAAHEAAEGVIPRGC